MKTKKSSAKAVTFIVHAAVIAAIYVVLTTVFSAVSFGPIQFRISEALVILPYFTPAAVPGVFLGCLMANIMGGAVIWDVIFGSLATLIGAVFSYLLRKNKYLVCIPPIISNTLIIPWVLKLADLVPFMMLTVGIGEILAVGVLENVLLFALDRYRNVIFRTAWS